MKAIVQQRYGPPAEVLRLDEIDKPVPGEGEVLIRVRAAGVNPLDWHFVLGSPRAARMSMGSGRPKVPVRGVDVSGLVEAIGPGTQELKPGDEVFGWTDGAFAEFAKSPQDQLLLKPASTTYEEAAAVPVAAITALQGLRDKGNLLSGQHALINGASGGVGTYAVQIAKALGAEVTGVCSARNVSLVSSIGADHVLDYAREDFTKRAERYDLILDNAGSHPISSLRRVLKPGGAIVYNSGSSMRRMVGAMLLSRLGQKVFTYLARLNHDDLALLARWIGEGKVRSVIDRTFPLEQTAAAISYVQAGHARGKVVVTTTS